jgi:hypothetical protein
MLRNAEGYVRCRTSAIPYDYWCMEKEERSRTEDRKEYQHVVFVQFYYNNMIFYTKYRDQPIFLAVEL